MLLSDWGFNASLHDVQTFPVMPTMVDGIPEGLAHAYAVTMHDVLHLALVERVALIIISVVPHPSSIERDDRQRDEFEVVVPLQPRAPRLAARLPVVVFHVLVVHAAHLLEVFVFHQLLRHAHAPQLLNFREHLPLVPVRPLALVLLRLLLQHVGGA